MSTNIGTKYVKDKDALAKLKLAKQIYNNALWVALCGDTYAPYFNNNRLVYTEDGNYYWTTGGDRYNIDSISTVIALLIFRYMCKAPGLCWKFEVGSIESVDKPFLAELSLSLI